MPKGKATAADLELVKEVNAELLRRGITKEIDVRWVQEWRPRFDETAPIQDHPAFGGTESSYPPGAAERMVAIVERLAAVKNRHLVVLGLFAEGWNPRERVLKDAYAAFLNAFEDTLRKVNKILGGAPSDRVRMPAMAEHALGASALLNSLMDGWKAEAAQEPGRAGEVFREQASMAIESALSGDIGDLVSRLGLDSDLLGFAEHFGSTVSGYLSGSLIQVLHAMPDSLGTVTGEALRSARDEILAVARSSPPWRALLSEPTWVAQAALAAASALAASSPVGAGEAFPRKPVATKARCPARRTGAVSQR